MEKKTALITGGAGFIGSHLADYCLEQGLEVTVIDDLSHSTIKNLDGFKVNFVKADIRDLSSVEAEFEKADYIFHLAGLADIVPSIENAPLYHDVNVNGTVNILELVKKYGCEKFVYAASSSCYGIPNNYPTDESEIINPMYPYALTKKLGEDYVLHYSKVYGFEAISLRLFNAYGTRSRTNGTYGAVFGTFLAQKLAGKPFTVVGDGTQKRDFIYATDVARAFYLASQSKLNGEVINIGAGKPQSVNKLVELLGGEKVYIPKRPGEPEQTFANIKKAKELLNWSPEISFEEGVSIILDNIDYWKDAPVWTKETIEKATSSWFKHLS
ncbi:MAG: NAD-dependent dehydratase [Halobacteriovorax sp.]|nr:NAD-dependent dehydratase [Halobacteriovorax sp.]|tara:strand:- start:85044 stop:86024 length:981 start_codon:yes stop_codon:yes gene_type:complete